VDHAAAAEIDGTSREGGGMRPLVDAAAAAGNAFRRGDPLIYIGDLDGRRCQAAARLAD
jgi:hypothetical protein